MSTAAGDPADALLSSNETNVLTSFLSAVDRLDPNSSTSQFLSPEWNMYAATLSSQVNLQEGREDLARATQDLISSGFGGPESSSTTNSTTTGEGNGMIVSPGASTSFHAAAPHLYNPGPPRLNGNPFSASATRRWSASSSSTTTTSFLPSSRTWPSVPPGTTQRDSTFNPYGLIPPQSLSLSGPGGSFSSGSGSGSGSSTRRPPPTLAAISTSLPSASAFPGGPASAASSVTPTSVKPLPGGSLRHSQSTAGARPSLNDVLSHSVSAPAGLSMDATAKARSGFSRNESRSISPQVSRGRGSFSNTPKHSRRATTTSSSTPSPPPPSSTTKQATAQPQLLTAEQKKQNHIHSEQKRRANIRRGYDALCDVVPALREAIRAEDLECVVTGKKRGRGRLLGEDGEKMDGRAGPRSESVVLQKTIEYINELLERQAEYLERLHAAQAVIPPGHPELLPPQGVKPWEKIWNGGIGLPLNGDLMEEDDDAGSDAD